MLWQTSVAMTPGWDLTSAQGLSPSDVPRQALKFNKAGTDVIDTWGVNVCGIQNTENREESEKRKTRETTLS